MTSKPAHQSALSPGVEALVAHERAPLPVAQDVRDRLLARAHGAALQDIGFPKLTRSPPIWPSRAFVTAAAVVAVAVGIVGAFQLLERPKQAVAPVVATTVAPSAAQAHGIATAAPLGIVDTAAAPSASSTSPTATDASVRNVRPAPSDRASDGLDEISLLRRARQADTSGDFAAVLDLVREHAQKYPAGRLSEEREVLRVKALVGLGRVEQARRAAARFRQGFPRSVLLHKVDEMVPSSP